MKKYLVGITAATAFALVAAVGVSAATVSNTGNGWKSVNYASSFAKKTTTVLQGNNAAVQNVVGVGNNSGGNKANHNTGGNSVIGTGGTATVVGVETNANTNQAAVSDCGCVPGNSSSATNSGNGAKSWNTAVVKDISSTTVGQSNSAQVLNVVTTNSDTGHNQASGNTGGNVGITTGPTTTQVVVSNNLNSNEAVVGGGL